MATVLEPKIDDRLDLTITRTIDAPVALVWQAWTEVDHVKQWWAPAPLTTPECEMDVRPGGVFRTLMRAPDGTEYPTSGVLLEVVEQRRIVFTDALETGWRPSPSPFMTAIITFTEKAGGTEYIARVLHKDAADREKHEQMGFFDGWGKCADQLAAVATQLRAQT